MREPPQTVSSSRVLLSNHFETRRTAPISSSSYTGIGTFEGSFGGWGGVVVLQQTAVETVPICIGLSCCTR